MTKHDFFHGTPHDVEVFLTSYDRKAKAEADAKFEQMKYTSWLNGLYVRLAVGSCLSKKCKYPKQPYGESEAKDVIVATEEMSEEEKAEATTLFFNNLFEMQTNFEKYNKTKQQQAGEE